MSTEQSSQKRLGAAIFYGVVALLAYLLYRVAEPVLVPLAWAGVVVVVFYPWHERLCRRWGSTAAASFSTTSVTLILIVPLLLLMLACVRQGISAARSMQEAVANGQMAWVNSAWDWFSRRVPGESPADLATLAKQAAERTASFLASEVGTVLRNVARLFFDLAVMILAMFYFFRDAQLIIAHLRSLLPFEEEHNERMIGDARDLIFASVTSSLVVAACLGLVGGIGFRIVGLNAPVFWGVMMAFFSFVPLVGSALIWVPASIVLMVQGHVGRGVFLLIFCAAIVGLVDNLARPWLISGRARLNGLLVFISVVGGIAVFGLLGVVLGPIVVAMAASVLDLYTVRDSPRSAGSAQGTRGAKTHRTVLE